MSPFYPKKQHTFYFLFYLMTESFKYTAHNLGIEQVLLQPSIEIHNGPSVLSLVSSNTKLNNFAHTKARET